jgi:hypothetical protein
MLIQIKVTIGAVAVVLWGDRGLKLLHPWLLATVGTLGCGRPLGRSRIETQNEFAADDILYRCGRPLGRSRIETKALSRRSLGYI